jgi:hypothetical protein
MSDERDNDEIEVPEEWREQLHSAMHNAFHAGMERGQQYARIDRNGRQMLAAVCGWAAGVMTGLVITGWLP